MSDKHAGGRPPGPPSDARVLALEYGVSQRVMENMGVSRFLACNENARQILIGESKRFAARRGAKA